MSEKSARAIVQITVEIHASSSWGKDCTIGQIDEQAIESVKQALRRGLVIDGLTNDGKPKMPARIIGTPKVTSVLVGDTELA